MKKSAPATELRSPIPFHVGSNGEFVPAAKTGREVRAEELFRRIVDDRSRRLGIGRRDFIRSTCGTAAALMVINQVYGCGGGGYAVDAGSTLDGARACDQLQGPNFIFDVQTHYVNPAGSWRATNPGFEQFLNVLPQARCTDVADRIDCFDQDHYIREVFINSKTSVAVLSAVPAVDEYNPLTAAEQKETLLRVQMLSGSPRLVLHGMVLPELGAAQLDGMQRLVEEIGVAAWKVYTPHGGWWLDDRSIGIPFIEKARALGVKIVCAHKGFPLQGFVPEFADPRDIGVVAAAFPDVNFVVYHSGYDSAVIEGPYNDANPRGVDRLVKTVLANNIGTNKNVYAELGSTWRSVMTKPTEAAHILGKLLKHVGEDRVVWGTDSIWYGSPQDQIDAFLAFQISPQFQAQYAYPALTAELKAKILGRSAAALYGINPDAVLCEIRQDLLSRRAAELSDRPAPRLYGYGPQTRREFFDFLRSRGGHPG